MKQILLLTTMLSSLSIVNIAEAQEQSPWQVRGRIINVMPQEDSSVNIGGDINVGNRIAPEVDISYFVNDNVAFELIAATTKHNLSHSDVGALGSTYVLPPTLTAQYHFSPDKTFSPYLGAGLNYSVFYNEKNANGITDLKVDGGVGYALQAGFDYWFDDHWGANVDIKKLFLNIDASLIGGTVTADIDLDPVIVGTGVSYRF